MTAPEVKMNAMTITVIFTQEYADRTGVEAATRTYMGIGVKFIPCLEDLLSLNDATGADVMRVELG